MVSVVVHLQLATEHVGGPTDARINVVTEPVVFAIAGPVIDHAGFARQDVPAVVAGQAQCVAVADHQPVAVAEGAYGIAVAVDHGVELAVFVVAVLSERYDRLVVHHALNVIKSLQAWESIFHANF